MKNNLYVQCEKSFIAQVQEESESQLSLLFGYSKFNSINVDPNIKIFPNSNRNFINHKIQLGEKKDCISK